MIFPSSMKWGGHAGFYLLPLHTLVSEKRLYMSSLSTLSASISDQLSTIFPQLKR
jgi:hypothetical protein